MSGNLTIKMIKALDSQLSHLCLYKKVLLPFRISQIKAITLYVLPNSPGGELDASMPPLPTPPEFSALSIEPSHTAWDSSFFPTSSPLKEKKKDLKKNSSSCVRPTHRVCKSASVNREHEHEWGPGWMLLGASQFSAWAGWVERRCLFLRSGGGFCRSGIR